MRARASELSLVTMAVRGHRLAASGDGLSIPAWEDRDPRQDHENSARRYLSAAQRRDVANVVRRLCAGRGGECAAICVGRTFARVLVRLPLEANVQGLITAIRQVATKELRKDRRWGAREMAFTTRSASRRVDERDAERIAGVLRSGLRRSGE